jgi:transcriptional regulator GlxA family with amidase domain
VHRVVALALPQVVAFDLAIPAQIFGHPEEVARYAFSICAERPGPVPTSTNFSVYAEHGLEALAEADTIVVPGFLPPADPSSAVLQALVKEASRGARIASVCIGAFALGAAGLLDHREATTHWQHLDDFARRFPLVRLRPDGLYVDEGQLLTSAGVAAGIDLCLHMFSLDHGAAAAADVARRMVTAVHRPGGQAQFARSPLPVGGALLARTWEWAAAEIERPLTVKQLAAHAGLAPRTFARRFVEETGMTPLRWLTAQRLLEARRLLEATDMTMDEVARRSGLGTASNLRAQIVKETTITPSAYRKAFRGSVSS